MPFWLPFDFNISLIQSPGIICRAQVRSAALVQFWSILLYPTKHRCVMNIHTTLVDHLCYLSVREWVATIPAHATQDDLGLIMTEGGASPAPHHLNGLDLDIKTVKYGDKLSTLPPPLFLQHNLNSCEVFNSGLWRQAFTLERVLPNCYLILNHTAIGSGRLPCPTLERFTKCSL